MWFGGHRCTEKYRDITEMHVRLYLYKALQLRKWKERIIDGLGCPENQLLVYLVPKLQTDRDRRCLWVCPKDLSTLSPYVVHVAAGKRFHSVLF